MSFTHTKDGSAIDANGRVVHFSRERFVQDICKGNSCFICGSKPEEKNFNNEHILPNWILNRYKLHSRPIHLPNRQTYTYGRYKIPCCEQCNTKMNEIYEKPIKKYFLSTPQEREAQNIEPLLYMWLGLIFLKTHLKDRLLKFDPRQGPSSEPISHLYSWDELYHLHSIVRAPIMGAKVTADTFGSMLIMPYSQREPFESFDYSDIYLAQAAFIRLDDLAIYSVFNDSGASLYGLTPLLEKISGPLGAFQAREILVELACCNFQISERSTLFFETIDDTFVIDANPPWAFHFFSFDSNIRGKTMYPIFKNILLPNLRFGSNSKDQIEEQIKSGRLSFLFDNNGRFIENDTYLIEGED